MIIGFVGLGAISSTLRYLAYGVSSVTQEAEVRYYTDNPEYQEEIPETGLIHKQEQTTTTVVKAKFCKFCGEAKEGNTQFCANCGAEFDS